MRNFLSFLLFAFCFLFKAYGLDIVKSNQYGHLEFAGSGNYKFFSNPQNRSIVLDIEVSSTFVKYTLPDGSFLKLDATNAYVTRFNAANGISELFTPESNYISNWAVSSYNSAILQSYVDFENLGDNYPDDFCYEPGTEIAFPCPLSDSDVAQSNNNSACSQQQNYLNNHGYNGYPTLSACLRPAEQVAMASTAVVVVACTIGQVSLLGCSASLLGFAAATGNYNHALYQCNLTYDTARTNLAQCLDSPVNGGGGGSSGGPGAINPTFPSRCFLSIPHGVCTGGGCTYWTEVRLIPC